MREIKLTQGFVATVDDEDYEWLSQWKWFAYKCSKSFYAGRMNNENGVKAILPMHRAIMGLNKGDDKIVDHINHNELCNQRFNLRVCSRRENCRNRLKQKNRASKYKGVGYNVFKYFSKRKQEYVYYKPKWSAHIKVDKLIHLGLFDTEEEAAKVYNLAAIKHFGEFAHLNTIE